MGHFMFNTMIYERRFVEVFFILTNAYQKKQARYQIDHCRFDSRRVCFSGPVTGHDPLALLSVRGRDC